MSRQRAIRRWPQLLSFLLAAAMVPAMAANFEFLYIDANEGSASGGHAAIRFGDDVFHFQHVQPGWLRLYRDDFKAFRFAYGYQENRSIYSRRIEISDDFYQALLDSFSRRLLLEEQHFTALNNLTEEYALLQGLLDPGNSASIELKSLGYFTARYQMGQFLSQSQNSLPRARAEPDPSPPAENNEANAIVELREKIAQMYGSDFVASKRRETWNRLRALTPTQPLPGIKIGSDRFQAGDLSFGQRYKNLLSNLAALDVLQAAPAVRRDAILRTDNADFRLNSQHLQSLRRFRDKLAIDLTQLLASERPDWGYPLLVGMARLQVLDATFSSGALAVLDRSATQEDSASDFAETELPVALQYTQRLFATANQRLASTEPLDERGYAQIELSATAVLHLQNQAVAASKARLPALTTTPSRPAPAKLLHLPIENPILPQYLAAVEERIKAYREQLANLYNYDLLSRNCVSEIFRVINATVEQQMASADRASGVADLSHQLLGGYIDDSGLGLIPFMAYEYVGTRYRVVSSFRLSPYREVEIRQRQGSTPDWLVNLRESNTLSSSVYGFNGEDAVFVFFTQDAVWFRPLQGSINLAAAGAEAVFGMLSWPWDGGRHLLRSVKGVAVSLPELVFFNIRKGSFPGLLPDTTAGTSPTQSSEQSTSVQ